MFDNLYILRSKLEIIRLREIDNGVQAVKLGRAPGRQHEHHCRADGIGIAISEINKLIETLKSE